MVPSAHVEVIKKYVECYNNSDVSGMLELVAEDINFRYINAGMVTTELSGKAAFREFVTRSAQRFKVREQVIKSIDMDLDCIEVIVGHYGILDESAVNGSGGNPYINTTGIARFVFEGDKIIELSDIL